MHMHDRRGSAPLIPVSAGVPKVVRYAALVGLVVIIAIVGMVSSNSRYGHVWPSLDSQHISLPAQETGGAAAPATGGAAAPAPAQ